MTSARVKLYIWLSRVCQNLNGGYTLRPMHEDGTGGDIRSQFRGRRSCTHLTGALRSDPIIAELSVLNSLDT